MTRNRGRSLRGKRVFESISERGRREVITLLGALSDEGNVFMGTVDAPTDGDIFMAYLEQILVPVLRKGDVVILDNLSVHKVSPVRKCLEQVGVELVFLPPYSPDLNPIELYWAWLKDRIRTGKPTTRDGLDSIIAKSMEELPADMAINWISHCGYGKKMGQPS